MVPVYTTLLDLCEAVGIRAIFGIPDPGFFHLFQAAEARGWTVVAPHHEAAGGFMAEGWARITGNPAICVGSLGPGMTNAVPAMAHAMAEHSPVLFLGGRRGGLTGAPTRRGRFQHIAQLPLFAPAVKYAAAIECPDDVGPVMGEALRAMVTGTPGPAYVEVPGDVMLATGPTVAPSVQERSAVDATLIASAAAMIAAARLPVILAGHGVHTARAASQLAGLARALACPVVQTPAGRAVAAGLVDVSFPYGAAGPLREILAAADLVIAVGTEIGEQVHFGTRRHWQAGNDTRRWIHIEADAAAIGVNRAIDLPMPGDLRQILPQLTAAVAPRAAHAGLAGWSAAQAATRAAARAAANTHHDTPIHPARLVVDATEAMPPDAMLIRDGGALVLFQLAFGQGAPRDVLWSQNLGHLGTGLPMAIGAMLAAPGRPALLLSGDSAMLFHIAELETAARLGLPLVCVVGVDHQWGLEVGMTRRLIGPGTAETGTHWARSVRFDRIAEGFGCDAAFVDCAADLAPVLAVAFVTARDRKRPFVVHAMIDPHANAEYMPGLGEFASWFAP